MKPQEKLQYIDALVNKLSDESVDRLDYIFQHYGYHINWNFFNRKSDSFSVADETLKYFSETDLMSIAKDYDIELSTIPVLPSKIWKPNHFNIFISHSSKEKLLARDLKMAFLPYGISGFVAHEEIKPTEDWREELLKGLNSMDGFVAILTDNFKESDWTDQEFGFALCKGSIFFHLDYGLSNYGFMSARQGIKANKTDPDQIAKSIAKTLASKNSTRNKYIDILFNLVLGSRELGEFETYLKSIIQLKDEIGIDNIKDLKEKVLDDLFFNHPKWIIEFNHMLKLTFNLEFISKRIFINRHESKEEDDKLPF